MKKVEKALRELEEWSEQKPSFNSDIMVRDIDNKEVIFHVDVVSFGSGDLEIRYGDRKEVVIPRENVNAFIEHLYNWYIKE